MPARPDLRRLRDAARALQRACRAGETRALERLRAIAPELAADVLPLAKVLAREYGYPSWVKLRAAAAKRALAARAQDDLVPELAARWFALAREGDLPGLMKSMAVKKRQLEAARALMRAQAGAYEAFVQAILAGLADRRPRVRFECAHALDQFGDARCVAPLAALMDDKVPRVRWMAMHALSCHACGEDTVSPDPAIAARIARAAMEDASPRVRRNAAVALGLAAAPASAPVLRVLTREADPKLRRMARWALEQCEAAAHSA
jgi:hypothetical protein